MTLREEVLKYSGILNEEEVIEEGKLGKALAIGALIASLAFGGFKGAQTIKDYKVKSSVSASTKYDIADYKSSTAESLLKISTDYSKDTKQSILNLNINANYGLSIAKKISDDVDINKYKNIISKYYDSTMLDSLNNYVENLENQNSKLEKTLNKSTYANSKPIRVNVDIMYDKDYNNFIGTSTFLAILRRSLTKDISEFFDIDDRLIDVVINGKREF